MSSNEYEIVKTSKEKYVNYKVYVRANQEVWFVIRRYKEFRALYDTLKKSFPDANFKIPPKKIFNNFTEKTIQERVLGLNKLVEQVILTPGAMQQDCAAEFFRTNDIKNAPLNPDERLDAVEDQDSTAESNEWNLGPTQTKKLTPKDFTFKTTIGKGSFGRVYLAQHVDTGKIYAIKVKLPIIILSYTTGTKLREADLKMAFVL